MTRKLLLLALLAAFAGPPARAADVRVDVQAPEQVFDLGTIHAASGEAVLVGEGETVPGDLYAFAGSVRVDGAVAGDAWAVGREVLVEGQVGGDLGAGAAEVKVTGEVGGDLRASGGNLVVSGKIGRNVLLMGARIVVGREARVGGTVYASGGHVRIEGQVDGPVRVTAGKVVLGGRIGGTVRVDCDELEILPGCRVAGDLEYDTRTEPRVPEGAVAGKVTRVDLGRARREAEHGAGSSVSIRSLFAPALGLAWRVLFHGYLAFVSLVTGILLFLFFRRFLAGAIDRCADWGGLGASFGTGLVALLLLLVLGVICIFPFLMIPLGFGVWCLLGALLFFGGVVGKAVAGCLVLRPLLRRTAHPVLALVVGVLVTWIVGLVPWLGGLVGLLVTLTGMGAVLLRLYGAGAGAGAAA